jgi:colanic acid biosynthesis glycosyl transferase WcaI
MIDSVETKALRQSSRKIVFVNRYFYPDESATSQLLTDLARQLASEGYNVHVVCSRQLYDNAQARLLSNELWMGIRIHRVWTTQFGRGGLIGRAFDYLSFYLATVVRLVTLLKRGDVVVAKTDPPMLSVVVAPVTWLRNASFINWLQDVFPEVAVQLAPQSIPKWLDSFLRRVRDSSLRAATHNVVLGERMREYLLKRDIPAARLVTIENWINDSAPSSITTEASELRHRIGVRNKFVVSYSGNLGRAHEFETILAAAQRLADQSDIVFLMIGGGANMSKLQAAVEANKLPNFIFLPYQPRQSLADSLAAADVHLLCLLPALEGLIVPSKFYGILASGRPAIFIGDSDGEVARKIRNIDCGVAVATGDGIALANAIVMLRDDSSLRFQQGIRARAAFEQNHTFSQAAQQWRALLPAV